MDLRAGACASALRQNQRRDPPGCIIGRSEQRPPGM